jgi:hypothetical protein
MKKCVIYTDKEIVDEKYSIAKCNIRYPAEVLNKINFYMT